MRKREALELHSSVTQFQPVGPITLVGWEPGSEWINGFQFASVQQDSQPRLALCHETVEHETDVALRARNCPVQVLGTFARLIVEAAG
jgi:hypothetical protein